MQDQERIILPEGNDPFLKQILAYGWTRVIVIVAMTYVIVLTPVFLSRQAGNFINPMLKIDALHDIGYWNQFALLLPFFIIFLRLYLNALQNALIAVKKLGVITMKENEFKDFISYTNNTVFRHKTLALAPITIATGVFFFALNRYWLAGHNTWNSPAPDAPLTVTVILSMVPSFVLYYILATFVFRLGAIYFVVKKFMSAKTTIHALHPDGAGGLSPLGNFSLKITFAGVLVGLCVLVGVWANVSQSQYGLAIFSAPNIVMVIGYIIGLMVAFFIPLLAARNAMTRAKDKTLYHISDHFNIAMHEAVEALKSPDGLKKEQLEQLQRLTALYDTAQRMPVYPFNAGNVIKFATSVLWPVVTMLLKQFYEMLS